jgi:hypothetical protein
MKPSCSLLIFFAFQTLSGFSQTVYRRVISDAVSRKGIPYATIKVVNQPDGAYADESGRFTVKTSAKDSLLVTCVGYQSKTVVPQQDTIFLDPVVVNLGEVKVRIKKPKEYAVGLADSRRNGTFQFRGNIHIEHAIMIKIPDSFTYYRIKGVRFNALHRNGISLVRLHIYKQNNAGLPGEELLPEDVIINKDKGSNDKIDLSRFNLILNDRVLFVGVENIQLNEVPNPTKNAFVSFGLSSKEVQNLMFFRSLRDPEYRWWQSELKHKKLGTPFNLLVSLVID